MQNRIGVTAGHRGLRDGELGDVRESRNYFK